MSLAQIWNNIVAYSLQIGLLVALGVLAPPLLKLRTPRAKLLFLQVLLVACLLLPFVQPWRREVVTVPAAAWISVPSVAGGSAEAGSGAASAPAKLAAPGTVNHSVPFQAIVLWLLLFGVVARLVWLGVGLAKLAGYRHRGREMESDEIFRLATMAHVRWLVSDEIPGPVTFGWRDPVVLLPARFSSLRRELREAILCHELAHVERRDWMFMLGEEFVRALLWFHPGICWVLGEIQLAREQAVDQEVIETTRARGHYVDALLAMAGAASFDLAPAPSFLRRRHLKRRIIGLLKEFPMSPISGVRLVLVVLARTGALAAIAGACWVASGAFPLAAAPTVVSDGAGVAVNTGDARLLQRTPVAYPFEALEKGVQGRVVVQASIDADGDVREAIVHCPRELCTAAADSVPAWRFDVRQPTATRTISIDFVLPPGVPAAAPPADDVTPDGTGLSLRRILERRRSPEMVAQVLRPVAPGVMGSATLAQAPQFTGPVFTARTAWLDGAYVSLLPVGVQTAVGPTLAGVRISGLSDTAASQLKSRLPVQAGDVWTAAEAGIVSQIVSGFDPPLEVDLVNNPAAQQWSLWIGPKASPGAKASSSPPLPPGVYATGDGVRLPQLLLKVDPEYTEAARVAGISGTVTLSVVAGADGTAQDVQVIGPLDPGLDEAAVTALSKWKFRPGTKDGAPVSVQTQVLVTFRVL